MTIRRRTMTASMALTASLVLILAGDGGVSAQDAAPGGAYNPARRVPPYFGQVGLTPDQRERIYAIRAESHATIAELTRRLEEAKLREMADCEGVLTDAQRKLLDQLRIARGSRPAGPPVVEASAVPLDNVRAKAEETKESKD